MKATMIFWTWLITLALGFIGGSTVQQSLGIGVMGTSIAAMWSFPYVVIMIYLSFRIKDFWQQQIVHAACTIVITSVMYYIDEGFVRQLTWLPFGYFLVGLIVQFFFYKIRKHT